MPSEAAMRAAEKIHTPTGPMSVEDSAQIIDREMDDVYQILSVKRGREILDLEAQNKELVDALCTLSLPRMRTVDELCSIARKALAKHQGETNEPT